MKNFQYRYLVPNGITFTSLTCGVVAILAAGTGNFILAGLLILASYVLDLFDGAAARSLNADSEFGLQLDSLVDMVSLGAAPAALIFHYLRFEGMPPVWVWVSAVIFVIAGAFRLARFNLLPVKESGDSDSVGLTISTGGATLALTVLTDVWVKVDYLPNWTMVALVWVTAILMVSKVKYPSFKGVFVGSRSRKKYVFLASVIGFLVVKFPFIYAWFVFNSGYLGFGLTRAGLRRIRG